MELRDGELVLRAPVDGDAAAVTVACQDPDMARFIPGFPSPYTEQDARGWIEAKAGDEGSRTFLIVDGTSGDLCGAIEVRLGETGSIGYWIAADARGRGVATRATKLLARWVLTEGGVERLELTTDPDNVASQRVAEKAGFTREGVLRSHMRFSDGRRDSIMFSLLPTDLESGGA
jgi:RimJ/RimL family protein N-acetyltransferase